MYFIYPRREGKKRLFAQSFFFFLESESAAHNNVLPFKCIFERAPDCSDSLSSTTSDSFPFSLSIQGEKKSSSKRRVRGEENLLDVTVLSSDQTRTCCINRRVEDEELLTGKYLGHYLVVVVVDDEHIFRLTPSSSEPSFLLLLPFATFPYREDINLSC